MDRLYRIKLQRKTGSPLEDMSWTPRDWKSASALWRYYSNNWPQNKYWLEVVSK